MLHQDLHAPENIFHYIIKD